MKPDMVLLTGAEGRIGEGFREEYVRFYRDSYRLRLAVRDSDFRDERFDDVVVFDLEDVDQVLRACEGVDAVVHLAGNPDPDAPFEELLGPNVVGTYNLFEGARRQGVTRIVYASSVHAIMGYPVDVQAHHDDAPRADSLYGSTKVFGEALCSTYAYLHEMSGIAIRIGAYRSEEQLDELRQNDNPQLLDIVITQRDMAQLIHRCLVAPDDVTFAIVNGVSDNRFKRMDLRDARERFGYEPQDDAWRISERIRFGREEKV